MTLYEQLTAVDTLFRELWEQVWAEQDKEVLRARLCEGTPSQRTDGTPRSPDFPVEELTIGLIHTIASGTEQVYRRLRELFPEPPGSRVVNTTRIHRDSWEVRAVEPEPPSSSGSS
jgi:hypothetical protein